MEILNEAELIQERVGHVVPVVTREDVLAARTAASKVHIHEQIIQAIVSIVQSTRNNPVLQFGASTRAAIMLRRALGAWAVTQQRDYVTADDLKMLARYVLAHRRFHPGAGDPDAAFDDLLKPHLEQLVTSSFREQRRSGA
jgi:MoxR-like ATPase